MIRPRRLPLMLCALLLGACASSPVQYYTLIPPAAASVAAAGATPPFRFEMLAVSIPPQNDQPQLVVREGGQGVAILDSQRWIAPLADEVRGALAADLVHDTQASDVSGMATSGASVMQIKVDLHRFDSAPGSYALIDAAWSVRSAHGGHAVACTSRISETVGAGYEQLVAGHQRALAELAHQIGGVAAALAASAEARCPAP